MGNKNRNTGGLAGSEHPHHNSSGDDLHNNRSMFKNLIEYIPDALIGLDQKGNIVLINQQAEQLFGFSQNEVLGQTAALLFLEEFQGWLQDRLKDDSENSTGDSNQGRSLYGKHKDGSVFPVAINLGPIHPDDDPLVLVSIRDLTEQRKVEEINREREKLLATAAAAAPVVFFKLDPDGVIQLSLGQSLVGRLENVSTVGRSIYDMYGQFPQVIDSFHRSLAGETTTTVVEAGGLTYEATYAPLKNEQGVITGVVGVGTDVTRHRVVESALQQSVSHFRTIFTDAILGIKVLNLDGLIVDSNPALQEMLGYKEEELLNKSFMDLTHPGDAPAFSKMFDELVSGSTDYIRLEKRYLHKSGQVIWGKLAMSLIRGSDGNPQFCIGMIEDISAQKEAEAELAELQRRMVDGAENERLHLSQELHDGPLQDLQAISYQIAFLEEYVQTEEGLAELEGLQNEVRKVAHSLRAICGELRPPALTPFGLEKAIRSHAEQLNEANPQIQFHLNLFNDGKRIPERVRLALFRIYQHSIANILKHAQAQNVNVAFSFDEDRIELVIEDDGKGFEVPLRWIELVREGHYGLVGSIERAEAVGGKLSLQSETGKGTRVCVTVPMREEDQIAQKERFSSRRIAAR